MQADSDGVAIQRWCFNGAVACHAAADGGWRLSGTAAGGSSGASGSRWIVDVFSDTGDGAHASAAMPEGALHDVVLERNARSAQHWWLVVAGERRQLARAQVFIHRDVVAEAHSAVPPQRVPWRRRLFWASLLALLRTAAGRRWVQRRYGV